MLLIYCTLEAKRFWTALKVPSELSCENEDCNNQLVWDGYEYPFQSGKLPGEIKVQSDPNKLCLVIDKEKVIQTECSEIFYTICQCDPTGMFCKITL